MIFPKKYQTIILLICLYLSPVSPLNAQTIKYIGSPMLNPFIRSAAKIYKAASFNIITKPYTRKASLPDVPGEADILGVAGDVRPELILMGAKKYLIGKVAIGVWVDKDNPVSTLSFQQLAGIYTGEIINWQTLGSFDEPIHVYIVSPDSPCRQSFRRIVLNSSGYNEKLLQTVKPDSLVLKRIGEDPGGIGFLSLSKAFGHKSRQRVKTILVNGQAASINNLNYQITRPLYLVTLSEPWGKEMKFITWVLSEQGQKIVKKFFIGQPSKIVSFPE